MGRGPERGLGGAFDFGHHAGREALDISFERVDLADAMDQLGQKLKRNILVDPNIVARVSCHLTKVDWRLALDAIALSLGCDVEDRGSGVLLFTRPPPSRVVAKAAPIGPLLRALAKAAGVNLVLTPGVTGSVDLDLRNLYWIEALYAAVEIAGCKLIETEGDVVVVVRDRAQRSWAPSPLDPTHQREVARLVERVEVAALGGDLRALARASADLRRKVEQAQPKSVGGVPAPPTREEIRLRRRPFEALRARIERAIDFRDFERIAKLFEVLRGELKDAAAVASAKDVFREPLGGGSDEVGLSIKLQLLIAEGNLLLVNMAEALADARYQDAIDRFEDVKELKDEMLLNQRGVFRRNAQALLLRGRSLCEEARQELRIEELYRGLRVQATLNLEEWGGSDFTPIAVVNGQILGEREGGEDLPLLVEIHPGRVRFQHEGREFSRGVK